VFSLELAFTRLVAFDAAVDPTDARKLDITLAEIWRGIG
jgi:hypothetical protein